LAQVRILAPLLLAQFSLADSLDSCTRVKAPQW